MGQVKGGHMIPFIVGVFIGAIIGAMLMGLVAAGTMKEDPMDHDFRLKEDK